MRPHRLGYGIRAFGTRSVGELDEEPYDRSDRPPSLYDRNADEICVMHEGEIVERGKHEELLALDGYYKRLCDMQSF